MKRRIFLQSSIATVTSLATIGCDESNGTEPRRAEESRDFFPQGIASGDPKPQSVIVWTRLEDSTLTDDGALELEVFTDEGMSELLLLDGARHEVTARADHDRCVKVRVENLDPGTSYWYRFVYAKDGQYYASPVGRTRTAPPADADVPVRFAFVSCQDYLGRYYNSYIQIAGMELDFIVHLGDYIYETTGDPDFQATGGPRSITLTDAAGALSLADGQFTAARSLDNYRELYRTYRGDPALQQAHARHPMIIIWDDHEFSDDCHGATATYLDGREDETDVERRQHANQVWFEYMPVDYREDGFTYDPAVAPPNDISIYRDFEFGRHLHLVMTDLRSYRTDHPIAEDAYPGAVVVTQADLEARGEIPTFATPYIEDIATFADGVYAQLLQAAAMAAGYPVERIAGPINATWINLVIANAGDLPIPIPPIAEDLIATLPRGISYLDMGKSSHFDSLGSRYVVVAEPFALWSTIAFAASEGASEDLMGAEQEQWFLDRVTNSTRTWKVWGNEYCLTPLQIDLTPVTAAPAALRTKLNLNSEDWNGASNRRSQLIDRLAEAGNVVALTGDVHAFFAGTPVNLAGDKKIVEFVTGSISSGSFSSLLSAQVASNPALADSAEAVGALIAILPALLAGSASPNANLAFAQTAGHGFGVVEVDATELRTTFYSHQEDIVTMNLYESAELAAKFTPLEFKVNAGSPDLYRRMGEAWQRWDSETKTWET